MTNISKPKIVVSKPEDILFILDEFSKYSQEAITTRIYGDDKLVGYNVAPLSEFTDLEKVYGSIRNKIEQITFMDVIEKPVPTHIEDPESFMITLDAETEQEKLSSLNVLVYEKWGEEIHDLVAMESNGSLTSDNLSFSFTFFDYKRGIDPHEDYVVNQLRSIVKTGNLDYELSMPD